MQTGIAAVLCYENSRSSVHTKIGNVLCMLTGIARVLCLVETELYSFIVIISSTNKYRKHKSSMLI